MLRLIANARFGVRLLRRHLAVAAVAIAALAIGIAANSAVFSVVYATLFAPLPFRDPEQLVMVWSRNQGQRNVTSAGAYVDWTKESTAFSALHAYSGQTVRLTTSSHRPEQTGALLMTPGYLSMLGNALVLGRDFLSDEGAPGKDQVVILTNRLWLERFGGDPKILGRSVRIDGKPRDVVGVMAAGPADRGDERLCLPLAFAPNQLNHDFNWLMVVGRLRPGVSLEQANANMERVARHVADVHPRSNTGWSASVESLGKNFLGHDDVVALWLLAAAVACVQLIACSNVATLLLALGTAREREIAVRASLGATRAHLFLQFLTESAILATVAGVLGVALAYVFLRVILVTMPPFTLPVEADVRMNLPVVLFTVGVSVLSGLLFGSAPAWRASKANVSDRLKGAGSASIAGGRHRLRHALVAIECGLAMTLLAGAGIAIDSLRKLAQVQPGFSTDHLLTCSFALSSDRAPKPEEVRRFFSELIVRSARIPGVTGVAVSTGIPIEGAVFGLPFHIAGQGSPDQSALLTVAFNMVTPDYYRTYGLHMELGRSFTEEDNATGAPVAIVNGAFAKRYLTGMDPLMQRIVVRQMLPGVTNLGAPVERQIVGVLRDVRNAGLRQEPSPEVDVPFWQSPWPEARMALRTNGDVDTLTASIGHVVQSLDPDLPMADVRTMGQIIDHFSVRDRFIAALLAVFAAVALILAALGAYGVMSFVVAQRSHEIGIRMALGASRASILRAVLQAGMGTVLVGIAAGSAGAHFVGRAMRGVWYGVGTLPPAVLVAAVGTLLAFSVVACLVPARHAASVDPIRVLRQE